MEKIKDKISIITICYNCASDLERTIKSVLAQTYSQIEYIIVDGESTDHTPQVLDTYKDRIECIISEPDDGIYDALNKGIRQASGEWILCLNAGDVLRNNNIITEKETLILEKYFKGIQIDEESLKKLNKPAKKILENKKINTSKKLELIYDIKTQLTLTGQKKIPVNDIEARFMKGKKGNFLVAYNVQSAVDYDTKLICAINVTQNSTDHYELPDDNENKQLRYCKIEYIESLLNSLH